MPRFVILRHAPPDENASPHWDFMLEAGESLRTWALDQEPSPNQNWSCSAAALPDHRVAYLTYEGPISKNRGHVTQWDAGTYRIESETATCLVVTLAGKKQVGTITLHRVNNHATEWQCDYTPK